MGLEFDRKYRQVLWGITLFSAGIVGILIAAMFLPLGQTSKYEQIEAHTEILGVSDEAADHPSNTVVQPLSADDMLNQFLRGNGADAASQPGVVQPIIPNVNMVVTIQDYEQTKQEQRRMLLFELKVREIRNFYARYQAPLYDYAEEFVRAADAYQLDYRLLPAISIIESGGGKHLFKPYNPFGWGQHSFSSFEEAIFYVAQRMKIYYYDLGWRDPKVIGYKYNGPTPQEWGRKAAYLVSLMRSEEELKQIVLQQIP